MILEKTTVAHAKDSSLFAKNLNNANVKMNEKGDCFRLAHTPGR